ncbi:hypothetical protein ABE10_00620, partial [Bacillus toyonensis]|nr:hypothetical protein [Bacillus toyonensis]
PRHDDPRLGHPCHELAEAQRVAAAQQRDHHGRLLSDAHQRRMQMIESDARNLLRGEGEERERGEVLGCERPHQFRRAAAVLLVQTDRSGMAAFLILQASSEPRRDLLEGAVLQETGEQQIPCLEKGDGL